MLSCDEPEYIEAHARKKISVLMATRGRVDYCARAIASLRHHSTKEIEVLIRVDNDDPCLTEYVEFPQDVMGAADMIMRGPRVNTVQATNELAERATGDYLMLWIDRATMLTPGWDTMFRNAAPAHDYFVMWPYDGASARCATPMISRKLYEVMGEFLSNALIHTRADGWLEDVAHLAGIAVPVYTARTTLEVMSDRTHHESKMDLWHDRHAFRDRHDERVAMAEKIRKAIENDET